MRTRARGTSAGIVAALAATMLASALAFAGSLAPGAVRKGPAERTIAELEQLAVAAVNAERRAKGLPPLVTSEKLNELARSYSRDMVERGFFDHTDPDGRVVSNRTDLAGITRWSTVAENIARNRGFKDPVDVAVREWMKSEGHRDTILDDRYTETGVGVWIAPDRTVYFTQIFLARLPGESSRK